MDPAFIISLLTLFLSSTVRLPPTNNSIEKGHLQQYHDKKKHLGEICWFQKTWDSFNKNSLDWAFKKITLVFTLQRTVQIFVGGDLFL